MSAHAILWLLFGATLLLLVCGAYIAEFDGCMSHALLLLVALLVLLAATHLYFKHAAF